MLNRLQDFVTEILTVPWPPDPSAGRYEFAGYWAEVRDDVLRMWYSASDGVPVTPVIAIGLDRFRPNGQ